MPFNSQPRRWQVGDRIANRYEIYRILGGGMGIVYICYDHEHKTPYALKTFQEKYFLSEETQKIFEREALVWIELERYPYIVRAYWVQRLEGRLFIVLEYIAPDNQGRNNLTHYFGNLSFPEILKFAIQFCYGMEYTFSKEIDAHRDIKPENIMVTSDKIVKITDFGLAKAFQEIELREEGAESEEQLGEGHRLSIFQSKGKKVCGTLPWMAPEQFDGYADKRSDIYSFGIVLHQMAANEILPFTCDRRKQERLLNYEEVPKISTPVFHIIERCLRKNLDDRFQSFSLIREELQELLFKATGERIIPPERDELEAWELSNKGNALRNLGQHKEAISCFDEAIRINPKLAEAWSNKGVALANLDRYQEAIACFDEAIRINPKFDGAWSNKGLALDNLDRNQEAIVCFDEAITINPKLAEAWDNKGGALGKLGRYQEAIACFDEAIRINPKLAGAWNNKGGGCLIQFRTIQ